MKLVRYFLLSAALAHSFNVHAMGRNHNNNDDQYLKTAMILGLPCVGLGAIILLYMLGSRTETHATYTPSYSKPTPKPSYSSYTTPVTTPTYSATTNPNYSDRQVEEYARNIIASLRFELESYMTARELDKFSYVLMNALKQSGYTSKEKVDQFINSGILTFIEEIAFDCAYAKTNNRTTARRIAESMRNNALALLDKHSYIDAEMITPFVGRALEKAIDLQLLQYEPAQPAYSPKPSAPASTYTPKPTTPQYASDECIVCMESFSNVSRLFLVPCGHDICRGCARSWFISNKNSACPTCRTTVDMKALHAALR